MSDSNAPSSDGKQWFPTTHWSLVTTAADPNAPGAHEALETLCSTYWRPLHRFVLGKVRSKEKAEDLTQSFFLKLLTKNSLKFADRDRGRFRTFLLSALNHFMTDEWRKENSIIHGGGVSFISFEDPQLQGLADASIDAEREYDRQWAMTTLSEARRLLQEEYTDSGRAEYFQALAPCALLGKYKCNYPELATRFKKTEEAIRQDVTRIRQRHRVLLIEAVANTVADRRDVDDELRYLFHIVNQ